MASKKRPQEPVEYFVTERRFTGTPAEILPQLDELIRTLIAARMWLSSKVKAESPVEPANDPRGRGGSKVLMAAGALLGEVWVGNKTGTW